MVRATPKGEGTTGVLGRPTSGRDGVSCSPSVLVCDPVDLSRVATREVLERNGFRVDTSARTAEEAVALAERDRPDICIVDARAPGGGLEATRRICAAEPGVPVVVMADTLSTDELFEAVRAGAVGYLPKQMDPERLAPALRGVLAGEAALPRHLVFQLVEAVRRSPRRRVAVRNRGHVTLTQRESEVFALLRLGFSTNEIARRMSVSPVTVRTHISAVLHKLRVRDRASALRLLGQS